jgi:two-component system NarL family sensor kinase
MTEGHPAPAWLRASGEARGIALLRLALVPLAIITEASYTDLGTDLFPWVVGALAVYAVLSLAVTFTEDAGARLPVLLALLDLVMVSLLVYTTGGPRSPLKFTFYVLPMGAALRLSPRLTASWAGLSVLAYLAVTVRNPVTTLPGDLDVLLDDSLALLWVSGAAVMLSALVGRRQQALVEFADMRRVLVQQALDAEAREQRRLAEALHDHAIQNVLLARQELTDVVRGVPGAEERARAALEETDRQLRHEVFSMHPLGLERAGLAAVLGDLAENAGRRGGFSADVQVDAGADGRGPQDLIAATARELLTNVAKHARATHVTVRLSVADGALGLRVTDDGRGMTPEQLENAVQSGHIGLAALTERIRGVDGTLDVDSAPGAGTTVHVRIPLPPEPG